LQNSKWDLASSPDDPAWDTFLTAMGVSETHRKKLAKIRPSEELRISGNVWTLTTRSELGDHEITFTLGEPVPATILYGGPDGTTVFTKDGGNKLVQTFRFEGKTATIIREYSNGRMKVSCATNGVSAERWYTGG
jgi:hypothetical protein